MYITTGQGRLGCSIVEMCGMNGLGSAAEIKRRIPKGPMTICVTSGYQNDAHDKLREAGFVPLVKYDNRAYGHRSECILWCAFSDRRDSTVYMPEGFTVKQAVKKPVIKKVPFNKANDNVNVAIKRITTKKGKLRAIHKPNVKKFSKRMRGV